MLLDDNKPAYVQAEPNLCKKCGTPMVFMKREVITSVCDGVLFVNPEAPEDMPVFEAGDTSEVAWAELETWWSCTNIECINALQKANADWPYEEGFEGSFNYA